MLDVMNYDYIFFEFQFLLTYWTTPDECNEIDIIYDLIMQVNARESLDDRWTLKSVGSVLVMCYYKV